MYTPRFLWLGQNNIAGEFSEKPGMDIHVHWLNPLFKSCKPVT